MRRIMLLLIAACILTGCISTSEHQGTESPQSSEPVLTEPVLTEPVLTEPVLTEPVLTESPHQAEESSSTESESEDTVSEPEETSSELEDTQTEFVWKRASPEELGLNPDILLEVREYVKSDGRINSFLIVKNGYLVVEEYYNGYDEDSLHNIYSCTKSVMSAVIGIAINNNHIKGVDENVLDFFPDYEFKYTDEKKMRITIKHLLTMTSGLKWGELSVPYTSWDNPFIRMINTEDWIKFVLDKPVIHEPGTVFDYNTGNSHVLSAIVQRATGMDTLSYAQKYLFGPLGIEESDIYWEQDLQGIYLGGAWLYMKSRDMAKFGLLYLNRGEWNQNQIIPREWVIQSTKPIVHIEEYSDYGYHWWVDDYMYFAEGYKGQFICILEDLNIVVVMTADISDPNVSEVFDFIITHIRTAQSQSS